MTTAGYTLLWNKLAEVIKTEFKGRGLDWEDENDLPMRIPWCVLRCLLCTLKHG